VNDNRAAGLPQHPKVLKKISSADAGLLGWLMDQQPAVDFDEGKKKYLAIVNTRRKEAYEQKLKDYQSKVNQSKEKPLAPEQNSPIAAIHLNNPSPTITQTSHKQSSTPPRNSKTPPSISAINPSPEHSTSPEQSLSEWLRACKRDLEHANTLTFDETRRTFKKRRPAFFERATADQGNNDGNERQDACGRKESSDGRSSAS
jgi:hypothetical protein